MQQRKQTGKKRKEEPPSPHWTLAQQPPLLDRGPAGHWANQADPGRPPPLSPYPLTPHSPPTATPHSPEISPPPSPDLDREEQREERDSFVEGGGVRLG